jgi:RimJ/RimL family protein N-acetyltransferase
MIREHRTGSGTAIELHSTSVESIARLTDWVRGPDELFDWAGASFAHPLDESQLADHLAESDDEHEPFRLPFDGLRPGADKPVGYVELCQVEPSHGSGTICRMLVAPSARRAGVGGALTRAALARGFEELGLHRIDLRVFDDNEAAIRMYEGVGFRAEGVLRDVRRDHTGRYRSYRVMSMLESEWRAA